MTPWVRGVPGQGWKLFGMKDVLEDLLSSQSAPVQFRTTIPLWSRYGSLVLQHMLQPWTCTSSLHTRAACCLLFSFHYALTLSCVHPIDEHHMKVAA